MIRVLIAFLLVINPFPTLWEALNVVCASAEAKSADPDISGRKNTLIWASGQKIEIGGRPGPVRTNLAQKRPDKNPILGIRHFLLLPGVLILYFEHRSD